MCIINIQGPDSRDNQDDHDQEEEEEEPPPLLLALQMELASPSSSEPKLAPADTSAGASLPGLRNQLRCNIPKTTCPLH